MITSAARIILALLCASALPHRTLADVTKLPPEQRTALLASARFEEIHVTAKVPKTIVALCTGGRDRMADPGQRWEPTDVIIGAPLPGKRLIWAAVAGTRYVVHYEQGGIAFSYHVLVATLGAGNAPPKVIWRAVGGPFKDYAGFADALRRGKLDDRLDHGH